MNNVNIVSMLYYVHYMIHVHAHVSMHVACKKHTFSNTCEKKMTIYWSKFPEISGEYPFIYPLPLPRMCWSLLGLAFDLCSAELRHFFAFHQGVIRGSAAGSSGREGWKSAQFFRHYIIVDVSGQKKTIKKHRKDAFYPSETTNIHAPRAIIQAPRSVAWRFDGSLFVLHFSSCRSVWPSSLSFVDFPANPCCCAAWGGGGRRFQATAWSTSSFPGFVLRWETKCGGFSVISPRFDSWKYRRPQIKMATCLSPAVATFVPCNPATSPPPFPSPFSRCLISSHLAGHPKNVRNVSLWRSHLSEQWHFKCAAQRRA